MSLCDFCLHVKKLIKHNLFFHCWSAILFPPPNQDNTHEIKPNFSLLTMSWGNTELFRSKLCRLSCLNCQKKKFWEQSVDLRWICIPRNKGSYLNKKLSVIWISMIFMIIISFISIKGSSTWPPWNQVSFLQKNFKIIHSKTHLWSLLTCSCIPYKRVLLKTMSHRKAYNTAIGNAHHTIILKKDTDFSTYLQQNCKVKRLESVNLLTSILFDVLLIIFCPLWVLLQSFAMRKVCLIKWA